MFKNTKECQRCRQLIFLYNMFIFGGKSTARATGARVVCFP